MKLNDMWWAPFLPVSVWLLMCGNWTPYFPRAWRGRKIIVAGDRRTYSLKMGAIMRDYFTQHDAPWNGKAHLPPFKFFFKDEGITWCMGWKGPHVDAFKTAVALESARG